jgi:hypothetical protein
VQFDKSQVLELLRSQGKDSQADQAENELPAQVDTERDAGLLARLGLTPQEIIGALAGGGGIGGVAGRLGAALGDDTRRDGDQGGGGGLGGLLGR